MNIFTIYLLDFVLLQVSKLSKCLQSHQNLDLTTISSLVDSTLHTVDEIFQSAANWLLEVMESTIGIKFTTEDITDFQSRVEPFFMIPKIKPGSILTMLYQLAVFSIKKYLW